MKNFLLIIFAVCAIMISSCKREKSVAEPSTPMTKITKVSGNQSGVWHGKIHIVGDVTVPDGETLTIDAGATVIAKGYYGITVLGSLQALGTKKSRISFSVADTTGYSDYETPDHGGWKGICFSKPDVVRLDYCDFSYGKTENGGNGGAMRMYYGNDVEISNCIFHHNTTRSKGGAFYAENSILSIHDCEVYDNTAEAPVGDYTWGVGFQFLKCDLIIHDMVFHDNHSSTAYGGGMNIDSCKMELHNAVFYNNIAVNAAGFGIQRCKGYKVRVSNILAYNNISRHYGGGLAVATSDPELNNLTIVDNYCGAGGGGMQMAFDASPTLNNCIFWRNHAVYEITETDTLEYYMGSQIWLWGADCYPMFNNGLVQYGLDSINAYEYIPEGHYNNMKDTDPMFVNEKRHDCHLLGNSPCINAGTPDVSGLFIPDVDLSGRPRIYNNIIDMGCYEWQGN